MAQERPRYQFGEFELDTPAATLRRGGQEIPLPPKAFQVLAHLIEHRRQVVSKQELVEALWKDTFVTDDALVQAITAVRKALGDDAENPRFIRTKPRVGYQFIGQLTGDAPATESAPVSVWEAPLARKRARTLMILIQVGYLGIYAALLLNLSIAADVLASFLLARLSLSGWALPLLILLALVGAALRLYLITTVALDHPQTGRQYHRLAPALFALDELTALTPLLLVHATGLAIALILIPVLAYSPFAQTTLMRTAYKSVTGDT
ncbi:MAG TPA: transcriptional regulator [Candidatus Acidoferrales bacterium]|nr:transcriptional regulator [Candidatus Acidoferrales bacterium]